MLYYLARLTASFSQQIQSKDQELVGQHCIWPGLCVFPPCSTRNFVSCFAFGAKQLSTSTDRWENRFHHSSILVLVSTVSHALVFPKCHKILYDEWVGSGRLSSWTNHVCFFLLINGQSQSLTGGFKLRLQTYSWTRSLIWPHCPNTYGQLLFSIFRHFIFCHSFLNRISCCN